MDKLEKFLRSLTARERQAVLLFSEQLKSDHRRIPGVKALSGMHGWYRARMGNYRIIFTVHPMTKNVEIRRITRKNEKTYKGL
ncbi:hypothetical protein HY213_02865 [Candidatus Peregrinibacteria bacterium]|nr:hypothetical protein [Candidatus Peregrinibacteria bacterium]